jgi:hypothetical protein
MWNTNYNGEEIKCKSFAAKDIVRDISNIADWISYAK